jgi:hypothetical protein
MSNNWPIFVIITLEVSRPHFELSVFSTVHCPSARFFLSWLCFFYLYLFLSFCLSKILISLFIFVTSYFLSLCNSSSSFPSIMFSILFYVFPSLWPLFLPSAFPLFVLISHTIWRFLQPPVKPCQQKTINIRVSTLQRGSDVTVGSLKLPDYRNRLPSFNH